MVECLSDPTAIFLIIAAFAAGIIDSIAGGGGLITVPALMLAGMTPVLALGTNKLQSLFGSFSASIAYAKAGHIDPKNQTGHVLLAIAGGIGGALAAVLVPETLLYWLLPPLLAGVGICFFLRPTLEETTQRERLPSFLFTLVVVPFIGFYDGMFGPGTGSFFMLAFILLAGFDLLKATAHTKLLNFSSNLGGFTAFALVGSINWRVGILMGIAQFIGAQIGAKLAIKIGARLIKPLLVSVCAILAIKLMSEAGNPWHAIIFSWKAD